jgi:putative endonuclease
MIEPSYCVYIMASRRNGTLYVGVTSDLIGRVWQHRTGAVPGSTAEYGVKMLVWFETHPDINEAITREKRIKRWRRAWKLRLLQEMNPRWEDLYEQLTV